MFSAIFTGITTIAAMIPGLSTVITSLTTAFFNAKVQLVTARIGGDVTVATALVTAASVAEHERVAGLSVIAGSKVLLFLTVGFALPWIIYEWKVVAIDNVFSPWLLGHPTSTLPIYGAVADWAKTIIGCLFGSGTALTVGHMFFNRNKTGE